MKIKLRDVLCRNMGFMVKIALIILLMCGCYVSCSTINKKLGLKDDHPIEEMFEDVVKRHTGIDIDLTPNECDEYQYDYVEIFELRF